MRRNRSLKTGRNSGQRRSSPRKGIWQSLVSRNDCCLKDVFSQNKEKYSTKNISVAKLDELTDITSDSFNPMAAIYTDKKYATRPSDCVSQLLAKWDKEDGKIESTYGNSSRPTGMWKNEKRTREIEQREKSNWKATVKKWEKENWIRGKGRIDYKHKKPDPSDIEPIGKMLSRVSKQINRDEFERTAKIS